MVRKKSISTKVQTIWQLGGIPCQQACGNSPRFCFLIKRAELTELNGMGYGLQHYFAQKFGRGPQNVLPFLRLSRLLMSLPSFHSVFWFS